MADILYTFGVEHPGALTLNNYPKFLTNLALPAHQQGGKVTTVKQQTVCIQHSYHSYEVILVFHIQPSLSRPSDFFPHVLHWNVVVQLSLATRATPCDSYTPRKLSICNHHLNRGLSPHAQLQSVFYTHSEENRPRTVKSPKAHAREGYTFWHLPPHHLAHHPEMDPEICQGVS